MMIVDIQAECSVCRYTEIQRFYHGVAFHSLGIPKFKRFVDGAPGLLNFNCTNCGEPSTPASARRGAVTYGFADGTGIIQAHFNCQDGRAVAVDFTLDGGRRLDPQSLPPWSVREPRPREDHRPSLTEDEVFATCGRAFHLKGLWRSLLDEHLETGQALFEQAAPGCWFGVGADEEEIEALLADIDLPDFKAASERGELVLLALMERPEGLPGFDDTAPIHGDPASWLQPQAIEALREGRCVAEIHLDPTLALDAMTSALKRARLEFVVNDTGAEIFLAQITTPRGALFEHEVRLSSVAQLAAFTAITPGEAGRQVIEEIVAELLGIDV